MTWLCASRIFCCAAAVLGLLCGCGERRDDGTRTIYLNSGGRVRTFDPVQAADSASRSMVAAVFDTLVEYDYLARPYQLVPGMLREMPVISQDGRTFTFVLRDDLYFHPDRCFGSDRGERKVTAHDVVFSLLRLADGRLHSPMYWVVRGRIEGIERFHELTSRQNPDDWSAYDAGISGLKVLDERRFELRLTGRDPRFLYHFALPATAPVSRRAAHFYGNDLSRHPVGSGAFMMSEWRRDYRIVFDRNQEFRRSFFTQAQRPEDRTRALPLTDRVVCYLIRQNLSAHLMFLQGRIDMNVLDRDNVDLASGATLAPALRERNIRLIRQMEPEIRYIGFNMKDSLLGKNLHLRRAIALAFDMEKRVDYSSGQLITAHSPVPPGIAGFDETFRNPWRGRDLAQARRELALAGFPGGIDPATGEALRLNFDQNGTSSSHRQQGEMLASDLRSIGLDVQIFLNSSPRFFQKLRQNQMQLFRLSWVGDYPDAENFLQVFYGPNSGGSNRAQFQNDQFDSLYRRLSAMPDGGARNELTGQMIRLVSEESPWILEGYPVSFQLLHGWLENFHANDFVFNRWKYLSVNGAAREQAARAFKVLSFSELRSR